MILYDQQDQHDQGSQALHQYDQQSLINNHQHANDHNQYDQQDQELVTSTPTKKINNQHPLQV